MAKKKLQVFISSTFNDLKNERQAAVSAILKAGHIPAGMELFTSGSKSQWETIKEWIDECDIYMLILGGRYGSIHNETNIGYTEMEYDYAINKNKPFFAVVIKESALDEKVKIEGKDVLELKHPDKMENFRKKVLNKISTFFSDDRDIKIAVFESIHNLDKEFNPPGWISGTDYMENRPMIEEISRINKENEKLREEIKSLQTKLTSPQTKNEFDELILAFKNIDLNFKNNEGKIKTICLLDAIDKSKEFLLHDIHHPHGRIRTSPWDQFIIEEVCPKLALHNLLDARRSTGIALGTMETKAHTDYKINERGRQFIATHERHKLTK